MRSFTMGRTIRPHFLLVVLVSVIIAGALILWLTAATSGLVVVDEVQQAPKEPLEPYELARVAAQAVAAAGPNNLVRVKWAPRAVEYLKQAQAAGYFDDKVKVEELKKDEAFIGLRGRDDFKQLVQELENGKRAS
jgi:hypothetical protein